MEIACVVEGPQPRSDVLLQNIKYRENPIPRGMESHKLEMIERPSRILLSFGARTRRRQLDTARETRNETLMRTETTMRDVISAEKEQTSHKSRGFSQ